MKKIKGLDFVCTCFACPEQYDVYDYKEKIVGYVRLRYGNLTCKYPDIGGELIYEASIGDGLCGRFESDKQRMNHLNKIAVKIIKKMIQEKEVEEDEED